MKNPTKTSNKASFLDVSEYILKEYSPLLKPKSPENKILEINPYKGTPEIQPLQYQFTQSFLTPFQGGLNNHQSIEDFDLDFKSNEHATYLKHKKKRQDTLSNKQISLMIKPNRQLEQVIQNEDESNDQQYSYSQQSKLQINVNKQYLPNEERQKHPFPQGWAEKSKSKEESQRQTDLQRQTIYDNHSLVDYNSIIENFSNNPETTLINRIKSLYKQKSIGQDEVLAKVKSFVETYMLQYENYCFQQSWKVLQSNYTCFLKNITAGIRETFAKRIGKLSFEQRRIKIIKYLQKKYFSIYQRSKKIWKKKVSYDCRKKVADGRLRIKGKFVTRQQVCELLGYEQLDNYTIDEIKEMLQKKYQPNELRLIICQQEQQSE